MNGIKRSFGLILCVFIAIGTASNFSLAEEQLGDEVPGSKDSEMDHSGMDHSSMGSTEMDHSGMDHSSMGSTEMDHSGMDHSNMDSAEMDHSMHGGMDHSMHGDHNMTLDDEGMVMNSNDSTLPKDCKSISKEYFLEVEAGVEYARPFPGTIFGMSEHEFKVEPCSKINVTFTNNDKVRHQWMVHQLPKYLYPQGMFHLEAAGGATKTGTFIVPSDDKTYLVHCDVAQHMEKGMKAQLVVGKGSGDLPSIPGVTRVFRPDIYPSSISEIYLWAGFMLSVLATIWLGRKFI